MIQNPNTPQALSDQLNDLKKAAEKMNPALSPEVAKSAHKGIAALQAKMAKREELTQKDLQFIEETRRRIHSELFLNDTLKQRFEAHRHWHPAIQWVEVEKTLRAHPEELDSLQKMQETGGEPELLWIRNDELVFVECAEACPMDRRDLTRAQAILQAQTLGAMLIGVDEYRFLHTKKEVDRNSSSWVGTEEDVKRKGNLCGFRNSLNKATFARKRVHDHGPNIGWRGMLSVKKT